MVEPVSTGALVAGALSVGAAALAKGILGEAAKDAYGKLKSAVVSWAGHNVNQLEEKQSSAREAVLAEIVDERNESEKQNLTALAQALVAALDEKEKTQVGSRVTVIATYGGMAAGRDQTFYYAPPPTSKDEADD